MSNRPKTDFFGRYAAPLVANGFTVTPTKGKEAFLRKWQNPRPTDPSWLRKVLSANRYPGCNIGIVCGRVVAIDIDIDDPARDNAIEALATKYLGSTQFKRVGRAPRSLLIYQPAEPIASIKIAGCIDVLSYGRQFVAFGIHPDTGRSYHWVGPSPATAKIMDLPVITPLSLRAFAEAVAATLQSPTNKPSVISAQRVEAIGKSNQRARQGELLGPYDARIVHDSAGLVVDGREALMAKLAAAEYAKHTHRSPEDLAHRVWAAFIAQADLSRPKGSNPRRRWSHKDALAKARAICRRNPGLKAPRRSRGGHPASHLHSWRRPGFWTVRQRERHLADVAQRISTPVVLTVARVMIEATDLPNGFCTAPVAEIAKRASCSTKSVTRARKTSIASGLWISGPGGVFVPVPLNLNQPLEKTKRKAVEGNIKVPSLYHLSLVSDPLSTALTDQRDVPVSPITSKPYQPDLFGAPVADLDGYRRGRLPPDIAAWARAEMRARGITQDELASELGISQPQLANAFAGRFGLSQEAATRLLAWLRAAA